MSITAIEKALVALETLGNQVVQTGGMPVALIDDVEKILNLRFPDAYRLFLNRYGSLSVGSLTVYGLCLPIEQKPSIVWALTRLRIVSMDMPKNLIPISQVEGLDPVACLQCQEAGSKTDEAPVILWRPGRPVVEQILEPVSPSFTDFLCERLSEWRRRERGLKTMESHVTRFEAEYLSVGKLPRNHVWRPYRFCSQDVVLGLTVVRHSIDNNCLEVDVCLTSDVPEYEPSSGAKLMASFLLSEAYKCGGSMEIKFTENVEDGHVPRALCGMAETYGVALKHTTEGRITPLEARRLYVAITEFPHALQNQIESLAKLGRLSQERACYAVHHGLWTRAELETIVLGSSRADSILGGDAVPEQRHLYQNDLSHARSAVMSGFLDRKLAKRARSDGEEALDLEDDVRPLEISFDSTYYAKVYSCNEELPVPWTFGQAPDSASLPAKVFLIAILRARDAEDLTLHFEQDLDLAGKWAALLRAQGVLAKVSVLVPREFDDLPHGLRARFATTAQTLNVGIMICPETTISLDTDAARRLSSSRIMRE